MVIRILDGGRAQRLLYILSLILTSSNGDNPYSKIYNLLDTDIIYVLHCRIYNIFIDHAQFLRDISFILQYLIFLLPTHCFSSYLSELELPGIDKIRQRIANAFAE